MDSEQTQSPSCSNHKPANLQLWRCGFRETETAAASGGSVRRLDCTTRSAPVVEVDLLPGGEVVHQRTCKNTIVRSDGMILVRKLCSILNCSAVDGGGAIVTFNDDFQQKTRKPPSCSID